MNHASPPTQKTDHHQGVSQQRAAIQKPQVKLVFHDAGDLKTRLRKRQIACIRVDQADIFQPVVFAFHLGPLQRLFPDIYTRELAGASMLVGHLEQRKTVAASQVQDLYSALELQVVEEQGPK